MSEIRDLIIALGVLPVAAFVGALLFTLIWWLNRRRAAHREGYETVSDHLRAVPATAAQQRAAVDMALKGVVLCLLGLVFWPLLLAGLTPFYYGLRKIVLLGLGIGDHPA